MDESDRRQHRLGTLLYALSGVMCGIGLAIMMPAAMALQSGGPQWGLTFWGWAVALAAVAVVGSTASFFGTKLSYAAGLGFMRNMQVVIGNKVSRLPLGWFKADSAGRLSRMVTQEMISTGQAAALYVGQLIKNAAAAIVFCAAVWLWSWQIGIMLTLSIPILFLLLRASQACVGKGNGLEDSAERDIAARIVEFARCQGALRACRAGADYAELEDSFVEGRKRSVRGLWWSALGEILSGASVQMLVVSMIIAVSCLGASGSIGALETVVMIGVALRFTTLLNEVASALFGMEDRRAMLDGMDEMITSRYETIARPKDGVIDFLEGLRARGIKMAIATLTARRHAEKALIDRDMMKYFEFMLTIEDVGVPKYEPDIYLEAARRLGLTAGECMVFEDAPYAGVTAKKAGFALCGMAEPAYAEGEDTLRQVSDVFVEHSFAELADKL